MGVTNYETIETALMKAGYVLFHATDEYADYDRHDEHCTPHVRVNRKTGNCRIDDLIVPADRLMAHLFPVLTPEKVDEVLREALSLWFAKHSSIELKDDNMFRNFVIARLREVV